MPRPRPVEPRSRDATSACPLSRAAVRRARGPLSRAAEGRVGSNRPCTAPAYAPFFCATLPLDAARHGTRVLVDRGPRHRGSRRASRRELRPRGRGDRRLHGTRRRHRHGQERHHLPEDRRHALLNRDARALHAPGRGASRRPRDGRQGGHRPRRLRERGDRGDPAPRRGDPPARRAAVLLHRQPRPRPCARASEITLDVGIDSEACPMGLAPTASTRRRSPWAMRSRSRSTSTKGFAEDDFAAFHPGGRLGKRFLRVADVMHQRRDASARLARHAPQERHPRDDARQARDARRSWTPRGASPGSSRTGTCAGSSSARKPAPASGGRRHDPPTPVTIARTGAGLGRAAPHGGAQDHLGPGRGRRRCALEGLVQIHDLWRLQLF